jgi:hypothetical protein
MGKSAVAAVNTRDKRQAECLRNLVAKNYNAMKQQLIALDLRNINKHSEAKAQLFAFKSRSDTMMEQLRQAQKLEDNTSTTDQFVTKVQSLQNKIQAEFDRLARKQAETARKLAKSTNASAPKQPHSNTNSAGNVLS